MSVDTLTVAAAHQEDCRTLCDLAAKTIDTSPCPAVSATDSKRTVVLNAQPRAAAAQAIPTQGPDPQ